jgi:hypothetical protein
MNTRSNYLLFVGCEAGADGAGAGEAGFAGAVVGIAGLEAPCCCCTGAEFKTDLGPLDLVIIERLIQVIMNNPAQMAVSTAKGFVGPCPPKTLSPPPPKSPDIPPPFPAWRSTTTINTKQTNRCTTVKSKYNIDILKNSLVYWINNYFK